MPWRVFDDPVPWSDDELEEISGEHDLPDDVFDFPNDDDPPAIHWTAPRE